MGIWPNSTGMVPWWSPTKIVQMVLIDCISRSWGQKIGFLKCNFKKSSRLKLQGVELSCLVYSIILRSSTKVVQIMPLGSKLTPPRGSQFYIKLYKEQFKSTGMVPGWSPTKIVYMVLIDCICRSRGQKIGFPNAIFKYHLVWNYKAQSFHIWYIASSRGPLPIFGGQN